MQSDTSQRNLLRFSTREIPVSDRIPFWREVFGRQICHVDMEPEADVPLEMDATMLALPSLGVAWCDSATPACWKRTCELVKDGSDDFALLMTLSGSMMRSQLGRDLEVELGEGVCILHNEPASIRFRKLRHIALMVPRSALSPLVANIEETTHVRIPRGSEALRLLMGYLATVRENLGVADYFLRKLVVTHIHDLVALAIGASRDGEEIARHRGLPAARLRAIKCEITANPGVDLGALAARQQVTARYVQMLFEEDGTTFSAYALDQRLSSAYRMLTDPRHAGRKISAIAFDAGFGDISYFNRSFRRRYGGAPSEIRVDALKSR